MNELLQAITSYCNNLKARMIQRCVKAEAEYQGKWKTMTPERLIQEINEELDDAAVYEAMREHIIRRDHAGSYDTDTAR